MVTSVRNLTERDPRSQVEADNGEMPVMVSKRQAPPPISEDDHHGYLTDGGVSVGRLSGQQHLTLGSPIKLLKGSQGSIPKDNRNSGKSSVRRHTRSDSRKYDNFLIPPLDTTPTAPSKPSLLKLPGTLSDDRDHYYHIEDDLVDILRSGENLEAVELDDNHNRNGAEQGANQRNIQNGNGDEMKESDEDYEEEEEEEESDDGPNRSAESRNSDDELYLPEDDEPKANNQPSAGAKSTKKAAQTFLRRTARTRSKSRGNYNMLNLDDRIKIINFAKKHNVDAAHKRFNICKSRIKRYMKNGPQRKKGGGRKTLDPSMEVRLLSWIQESTKLTHTFPNRGLIKSRAKELSKVQSFLASKGWCDKFFKRNAERLSEIKRLYATLGQKAEPINLY